MTIDPVRIEFVILIAFVCLSLGFQLGRLYAGAKGRSASGPRKLGKARAFTKAAGSNGGDCVELYVGNLSYDMTEDKLRKTFEQYGAVKSARLIMHRINKRSKGFGFVEMPVRKEALAAIAALNDQDVMGRKMRVNEARGNTRPN